MKSLFRNIAFSAVAVTAAASLLSSCAMEEPFAVEGEGALTITTEINGDVIKTRAIEADELAVLRENCIVYIENNKGVIRKYKGLDNIPEQIRLQTGSYVAEAWSGDSVPASFSAKFYRGYQKFDIAQGQNSLTLKCNIANVVVSLDPESFNVDLDNMKVTFFHSRDQLEFTRANMDAKGYFMMPNADKDLNYKIEGTKTDGTPYVREGIIPDVQRAHEYCMTISQDENVVTDGGALIRISIADIPLIEETVEIFPGPSIRGLGFNMDEQIASVDRIFQDTHVYVKAYQGLSSVLISFSDNFADMPSGNILEGQTKGLLAQKGITLQRRSSADAASSADGENVQVDEIYLTFSKDFLQNLPVSTSEYVITIEAIDDRHREGNATLRIANSSDAVEVLAPVSTVAPDLNDPWAIGAHKAVIPGMVNDAENVTKYGIKYREQGSNADWTTVYASAAAGKRTRAMQLPYTVTLTGLEAGKTYEYKAFSDDYDSPAVMTFTTEAVFKIPNASFEDWSTYTASTMFGNKSVILPGSTGNKSTSYWGSGNEGSATVSKTLTNAYDVLKRTGSYSARLASDQSAGVLAAGNIFVGEYVKTVGTNGVLSVGREYNGTHPTKVRLYCNYRPGEVDILKDTSLPIVKNGKDHGQIYIGLTSGPMELRTADKFLFTPERDEVLAYGEVTFTDNYGNDGELKMVEITFNYNDKAKTQRPTHLVIVATAAKYGDYFSGSSKSVMIIDDVELIYE